jgi:two-component system NtrC family sensor kinase
MAWFHHALSLRAKITASFTLIVVGGTALSTLVGSRIITNALLGQAQQRARQGLDAARTIYAERLDDVRAAVTRAADARAILDAAAAGSPDRTAVALGTLAREGALDFLGFVDAQGRVFPADPAARPRHPVPLPLVVTRALDGQPAGGTEILSREFLGANSPALADRARLTVISVPNAASGGAGETTEGLTLLASAPVRQHGRIVGAMYGGVLLNRNYEIVDRVKRLLYGGEKYDGRDVGTVSLFLRDVRIATNVMSTAGRRAIGTRVSSPVAQAVLERGQRWDGRAFVVNGWYVASYEPIRDGSGAIVGILYAGLLEQPFLAARTEVMLTFLVVCVVGLVVVFGLTYLLTRTAIRPLEEMAAATRRIAAGHLDVRVTTGAHDEIGVLATSFNTMLDALQAMKRELEDWARTLENKVQERTDELVAVQARMAQSEKLASIGRLAAGVAHGINNPLGGVLTLTMLALEDCGEHHPLRADLETVVKQALRCREIVKGLLDFSRQTDARASKLSANPIVDSTLSLLERQAIFYNIKTVRRFQDDLPPVFVDPGQLQEVIINIVLNAVDAMEEKGVLTVETATDPDRHWVVIRISDTGKGIPPGIVPLIFEPFFTTKKVGQGTGLGLAIVHGIVTGAGGTVNVISKPGQTTFTVRLPVAGQDVQNGVVAVAGRGAGESPGGR